MASGRRVGQRPDCRTFLCKFWHFQMAVSQWKLARLTPNFGILWISVCSFWLCESIVAIPIIYRLVPRPFTVWNQAMQPCFTEYFSDIGHPCYDQLTPVERRYPLTRITWLYCGLKFVAHRGHVFFFKLTADQVLVFHWIAGSSLINLLKTGQGCSEGG